MTPDQLLELLATGQALDYFYFMMDGDTDTADNTLEEHYTPTVSRQYPIDHHIIADTGEGSSPLLS